MAYTNANWITITDLVARETALRAYIAEIEELETPDITSDGKSRSSGSMSLKLDRLYKKLDELVSLNARTGGRTVHYARKR